MVQVRAMRRYFSRSLFNGPPFHTVLGKKDQTSMQAPRILLSARRCLVKTWSWPWLTRSFTDGLGTLGNLPIKVCGPGLPHAEMSRFWTYSMESPYWAPCKYPIGTRLTGNSDPVPICVPFTPIHRRWLKKDGGYRFVQSIVKKNGKWQC